MVNSAGTTQQKVVKRSPGAPVPPARKVQQNNNNQKSNKNVTTVITRDQNAKVITKGNSGQVIVAKARTSADPKPQIQTITPNQDKGPQNSTQDGQREIIKPPELVKQKSSLQSQPKIISQQKQANPQPNPNQSNTKSAPLPQRNTSTQKSSVNFINPPALEKSCQPNSIPVNSPRSQISEIVSLSSENKYRDQQEDTNTPTGSLTNYTPAKAPEQVKIDMAKSILSKVIQNRQSSAPIDNNVLDNAILEKNCQTNLSEAKQTASVVSAGKLPVSKSVDQITKSNDCESLALASKNENSVREQFKSPEVKMSEEIKGSMNMEADKCLQIIVTPATPSAIHKPMEHFSGSNLTAAGNDCDQDSCFDNSKELNDTSSKLLQVNDLTEVYGFEVTGKQFTVPGIITPPPSPPIRDEDSKSDSTQTQLTPEPVTKQSNVESSESLQATPVSGHLPEEPLMVLAAEEIEQRPKTDDAAALVNDIENISACKEEEEKEAIVLGKIVLGDPECCSVIDSNNNNNESFLKLYG